LLARAGLGRENVKRIYTELSPCGKGYKECDVYIANTFHKAKVTWSFTHPVEWEKWREARKKAAGLV
jgi:hypothetical protein